MKNKKVLLGMSGGVDSTVAAILLKNQGYEVIGATMKLFDDMNAETEAKSICEKLNIPHYIIDLKQIFKDRVICDFIEQYKNCRTPNPCIECNKYLKFGAMYEKAKELECEYIATGHYAKAEYSEGYKKWLIKKSNAGKKDQSYVLWNMPQDLIEHVLFPLGEFKNKAEIRKIAEDYGLNVAQKPDSEDICFIPCGDYKSFLEKNSDIKSIEGNIVNSTGDVLGKHSGLYKYTIGQRKGLGISNPVPLFVLGFNKEKNEVIVGEEKELYKSEIVVSDINLILKEEISDWTNVDVKTRYTANSAKAKIKQHENTIDVKFDEPQRAITPGQSAVFYIGDIVLGGGKIVC